MTYDLSPISFSAIRITFDLSSEAFPEVRTVDPEKEVCLLMATLSMPEKEVRPKRRFDPKISIYRNDIF